MREERYCTAGKPSPEPHLRGSPPVAEGECGNALGEAPGNRVLAVYASRARLNWRRADLQLTLELAAVLLHRARGRVAALTKLTLHAGTGPLDLAHRAVAGGEPRRSKRSGSLHALADLLELCSALSRPEMNGVAAPKRRHAPPGRPAGMSTARSAWG